jgi:hypothetical protein
MQDPEFLQSHFSNISDDPTLSSSNITTNNTPSPSRLIIKLPPMASNGPTVLRRSGRHRVGSESQPSGSEYHESERSMERPTEENQPPKDKSPEQKIVYAITRRGRKVPKKSYHESLSSEAGEAEDFFDQEHRVSSKQDDDDGDDEEEAPQNLRRNTRSRSKLTGFIVSDEDGGGGRYEMRSRSKKPAPHPTVAPRPSRAPRGPVQRAGRLTRRNTARAAQEEADVYVDQPSSGSVDADGEFDDAVPSSDPEMDADPDQDGDADPDCDVEQDQGDGRPYALRQRAKINYAIPPPLEETRPAKGRPSAGRGGGRNKWGGGGGGNKSRGPGWSATGAELGRWMGMGGDDSVCITFSSLTLVECVLA